MQGTAHRGAIGREPAVSGITAKQWHRAKTEPTADRLKQSLAHCTDCTRWAPLHHQRPDTRAAILSSTESIPLQAVSLTYSISKGMIADQVQTSCLQSYRGTNYLSNRHDNIVGTHMLHLSFVKRTTKCPHSFDSTGPGGRAPPGRGGITEGPCTYLVRGWWLLTYRPPGAVDREFGYLGATRTPFHKRLEFQRTLSLQQGSGLGPKPYELPSYTRKPSIGMHSKYT